MLACGARLWGAVVVTKDLEGNLTTEHMDHMVEEGAAGLASVGFVVGLFAPPLLAATAIGALLGAGAGKVLHEKTGSKIEEAAAETIPIGGAGLIVAYKHADAKVSNGLSDARDHEGGRRGRGPPRSGPQGSAGRCAGEAGGAVGLTAGGRAGVPASSGGGRCCVGDAGRDSEASGQPPQHALNLRPLPHGHGSLRPVRAASSARICMMSGASRPSWSRPAITFMRRSVCEKKCFRPSHR